MQHGIKNVGFNTTKTVLQALHITDPVPFFLFLKQSKKGKKVVILNSKDARDHSIALKVSLGPLYFYIHLQHVENFKDYLNYLERPLKRLPQWYRLETEKNQS